MACHLNCHGELNALLASLPFVAFAIGQARARLRAWKNRI
jgi:hypothetical protein